MKQGVLVISFSAGEYNGIGLLARQLENSKNIKFAFFSKSLKTVFFDIYRIIKEGCKSHTVVINYVFLCLLFAPVFRLLGKKVIFIPHEGEPLFPASLKPQISFIRRIVASKRLTQLSMFFANKTLCLSRLQAAALGANEHDIIHLGADFPTESVAKRPTHFFFPNRKHEEIKGFKEIASCHYLLVNLDDVELNYHQMLTHYAQAQVVLIPSIIETYSYCMVEAMLANCIIVTTKDVGLAHDLAKKVGTDLLNDYGVYIVDKPQLVAEFVNQNYDMLMAKTPKTKELAIAHGLDGKAAVNIMEALDDGKK
ncbi:hypothetical protein EAG18_19810 [Pseudoalteromonas sp. J010]|uniref:hypothetical protein n=1 Tax=Pseudoalteromonas sp. J010 TaxID=998465 RepID=UPI000F64741E|nr:hypothetical protein [Pseudoalteromonas sp. J010]RRS06929.1 hypothetical protein EAG18_19810 [Pseudoalteromonas sp. J010]